MNEPSRLAARISFRSAVMTQGNNSAELLNSWQRITQTVITGINRAGQRPYWRGSDGLRDKAPSDP